MRKAEDIVREFDRDFATNPNACTEDMVSFFAEIQREAVKAGAERACSRSWWDRLTATEREQWLDKIACELAGGERG